MSAQDKYRYPDSFTFWRNVIISSMCGTLFSLGWWIYIDAYIIHYDLMNNMTITFGPGILGTVGLVFVQLTPYKNTSFGYYIHDHRCSIYTLRTILFIAFMLSFSALSWSMYIWIIYFVLHKNVAQWPGVATFIQNILILTSNLIYKFVIKDLRYDY